MSSTTYQQGLDAMKRFRETVDKLVATRQSVLSHITEVLNGEAYWLGLARFGKDEIVQHFMRDKAAFRLVVCAHVASTSLARLYRLPRGETTLNAFAQFFEEYDYFTDSILPKMEKEALNASIPQNSSQASSNAQVTNEDPKAFLPQAASISNTQVTLTMQLQSAPIPLNFYNWPTSGWASPQFRPQVNKDPRGFAFFQVLDIKAPWLNTHLGLRPELFARNVDVLEVLLSACSALSAAYNQLTLHEDLEGSTPNASTTSTTSTLPVPSTTVGSPAGRSLTVHRLKLAKMQGSATAKLDGKFKSYFLAPIASQLSELATAKFKTLPAQLVGGPKYTEVAMRDLLMRQCAMATTTPATLEPTTAAETETAPEPSEGIDVTPASFTTAYL